MVNGAQIPFLRRSGISWQTLPADRHPNRFGRTKNDKATNISLLAERVLRTTNAQTQDSGPESVRPWAKLSSPIRGKGRRIFVMLNISHSWQHPVRPPTRECEILRP